MRAAAWVVSSLALILATGCTTEDPLPAHPLRPTAPRLPDPPPPEPLRIALVSGDGQRGTAGAPLAQPFVVRVTDEEGRIASGRLAGFEIISGAGIFDDRCDYEGLVVFARVEPDGMARITYQPSAVGEHAVVARVTGGDAVTFSVSVNGMAVRFENDFWGARFSVGCRWTPELEVHVGTTVEWYAPFSDVEITYTITSTSVPPGGRSFDSGVLTTRDRFRFVPNVAGTWEYRDEVSGATGRLIAVPG